MRGCSPDVAALSYFFAGLSFMECISKLECILYVQAYIYKNIPVIRQALQLYPRIPLFYLLAPRTNALATGAKAVIYRRRWL